MKTFLLTTLLLLATLTLNAQQQEEIILENLLVEFLAGASLNDAAIHDRFWADELIYTSAAGERFGKNEIMRGLSNGSSVDEEMLPAYSADEIQTRVYGNMAIVAFRLVAEIPLETGGTDVMYFYNTGTFLKRDGEWRAVAWQATRITD